MTAPAMRTMLALADCRAIRALLRHQREAANLSQDEVGARVGRCRETVNRWELGKNDPSAPELFAWAAAVELRIPVTSLVTFSVMGARTPDTTSSSGEIPLMAVRMGDAAIHALTTARKSLGLSSADVAKRIGLGAGQIAQLESEPASATLTPMEFAAWCVAVGCTVKVTRNDVECGA